eukprot:1160981-Pelagomonas_calceolata.AAC.5
MEYALKTCRNKCQGACAMMPAQLFPWCPPICLHDVCEHWCPRPSSILNKVPLQILISHAKGRRLCIHAELCSAALADVLQTTIRQ